MEKYIQYAAAISAQMVDMFNEESENHINLEELNDEDNLKAFIHAFATVAPNHFLNKLEVSDEMNHLEFNHMANKLCFEFMTKKEDEE